MRKTTTQRRPARARPLAVPVKPSTRRWLSATARSAGFPNGAELAAFLVEVEERAADAREAPPPLTEEEIAALSAESVGTRPIPATPELWEFIKSHARRRAERARRGRRKPA
jgi:hypothetical protein